MNFGSRLHIFDGTTHEVLASYGERSRNWGHAYSADGRLLAMRSDGDATLVEVFHALSGHRVAALRTEADAQFVHATAPFVEMDHFVA